jgi:hypothetical protein
LLPTDPIDLRFSLIAERFMEAVERGANAFDRLPVLAW